MKKLIIDYMDSIWNTVCEDTMFDRVHKKFGISFDEFYHLVMSDEFFEDCPECLGHGAVEKTITRGGIEIDCPVTCSDCCGMGRVIKEQQEFFISEISKLF